MGKRLGARLIAFNFIIIFILYTKFFTEFHVTPNHLKECITNLNLKTKVKPILLSFSGLPDSGKTAAVTCVRGSTRGQVLEKDNQQVGGEKQPEAGGIAFHEMVAAKLSGTTSINDFTAESCFAPVILSAFKEDLLSEGKVPRFDDPTKALCSKIKEFQHPDLDEHLCFIYQFLSQQDFIVRDLQQSEKKNVQLELSKFLIESLPEGIAFINIWDVTFDESVRHFLAALHSHLYNHHMWLFLGLETDIPKLDEPPEMGQNGNERIHATLMKWRPRLHYLLRNCRMSEGKREKVCTIFATHKVQYRYEELTEKVKKLEDDVQPVANQIGISSLLEDKIEKLSLLPDDRDFQGLHQKFQSIIIDKPFEDIPIAWIFLRTLFYRFDWKVITRCDLQIMAEKCNIDKDSLTEFCKFYMSFGSILDLSLVNPKYQYVIVKPIGFLRDLGTLLNPSEEILQKYPPIASGIVPETACLDLFNGHILAYMDALVSLTLAIRLTKHSLEFKNEHGLLHNDLKNITDDIFYYVPLTRFGDPITKLDFSSVHVITSINTPHIFKQVAFTKYFLQLFPESKLILSKHPNQTIIMDSATGITVTLVSHSPATRLTLSKPDEHICSKIIQTYEKIAESAISRGIAAVNYKFIKVCAESVHSKIRYIPSCHYHILPDDKLCSKCNEAATGDDVKLRQVWNKTLKEHPVKDCFQSTEGLTQVKGKEIAEVAAKIASFASKNAPVHLHAIIKAFNGTDDVKDLKADDITINRIILSWYESKRDTQEPRRQLARKIFEAKKFWGAVTL
ncbi:PREDICTED: uncharacterized protein LOC109582684 [Amphimedon queenslandica]|uniref:Death domain-containing protein n=2 Tax=Amphimedon queenslandica TaxID=400682 RepID=A0AAN0J8N0_AMPQE|nr:PREDICTED: uncharacterized protein LOC109582684 [Amphimedon queenslandica]|eukprot:XP_019853112.1 PREDICTED: uncharacterized protein LOC109582684 [Amphimedon queenslandica]